MAGWKKKKEEEQQQPAPAAAPAPAPEQKAAKATQTERGKAQLEKAKAYKETQGTNAGYSQRAEKAYDTAVMGTRAQNASGVIPGTSKATAASQPTTLHDDITNYLSSGDTSSDRTDEYRTKAQQQLEAAKSEKDYATWLETLHGLDDQYKSDKKRERRESSPFYKAWTAATERSNQVDDYAGYMTDPVTQANVEAEKKKQEEETAPAKLTPAEQRLAREEARNQEDAKKAKEGQPNFLENAWNAITSAGNNVDQNAGYITDPIAEAIAEREKQKEEPVAEPEKPRASAADRKLAREEKRNQEDTAAALNDQRDELLRQYGQAVTQDQQAAGYVTDPNDPEYAKIKQNREDLKNQLIEINRASGRDLYDGLADEDRMTDAVSSWAGGRTASSVAGAGALLGGLDANVGYIDDTHRDLVQRQANAFYAGDYALAEELQNQVDQYEKDHAGENRTALGDVSDLLLGNAQGLQEESDRQWQNVTEDLSEGGKFAANIVKTGADVVADMIDNAIVPGSGTIRMYMGAGGGGALEQLARENNDPDAVAIAALTRGASAWLSTKLAGGMEAVYGKSVLGKGIDKLIGNASPATQTILKPLLNTEGLEEGLEDVLNYCSDIILNLSPEEQMNWDEAKQDALVGYILGVVTNGLAGGVNYDAKKRQALAQEAIEFAQSGMDIDEAAQAALQNTKDQVVMKPNGTGTEARMNREEARAQADAANVQQDQAAAAEAEPTTAEPPVAQGNQWAVTTSDGQTTVFNTQEDAQAYYDSFNPEPEAAEPEAPAEDTPQEPPVSGDRQTIRNYMSRGSISSKEAAQIRNNPALAAAFEQETGKSLDGLGEKAAAKLIQDEIVKRRQVVDYEGKIADENGNIPYAEPGFEDSDTKANKTYERAQAARADVAQMLSGDSLTVKDASRIVTDKTMWAAFGDAVGIDTDRVAPTVKNAQDLYNQAKRKGTLDTAALLLGEEPAVETDTESETAAESQPDVVNNLLGKEQETSGEPSERTQEQRLSREEARNEADTEKVQNDKGRADTEPPENPPGSTHDWHQLPNVIMDSENAALQQESDTEYGKGGYTVWPRDNSNVRFRHFDSYAEAKAYFDDLAEGRTPAIDQQSDEEFEWGNGVTATETPTEAQEASGNINTQEEQGNAPEGELNAQEAQEEQTAPETETNPESKPAKQKTGKKRVTNSGKPDANTEAAFDALVTENGSIEKGENPARDINVPTKDTNSKKVGEGVRTIFEAAATPEERIASLKAAVVNGDFGHVTVKNDARSKAAVAKISKDGWSRSVGDFLAAVEAGKSDADTIALGAHLLNEAGNSPEASGRDYIELAMAYNDATNRAGQGLAAARILKTLTPEGKLYGFEKTVEKINREIKKNNEKKSGKKQQPEVKLDEKLVEDYLNAKTEEERDKIHDKLAKNVAEQVPNTLRDKFTALRYLNMLGNFKTQARNVMGNVGMTAVQKVKNEVVSGLEGIASKLTGGEYERMYKGFYGTDLHKAAMEDFGSDKELQKVAKGEAKYSDVGKQAMEAIQDKKDPFSNKNPIGKALNLYSKATTNAMEYGDFVFVRANYADALAGYMNAHNISAADWKAMVADPKKSAEVDKARTYAIKQAQEATFRDTNAVSKFMSTMDSRWPKPMKALAQGVIPFRKTPANVLVRMEEYSPLGLFNTAVKTFQATKGTATGSDVIDSLAKNITGAGLVWLGWALRSNGLLRTKDKDDKEESVAKLKGQQDYSVTVGDTNYTLDWLTPASGSLFMGSELFDLVEEGGLTWADAMTAMTSLTNPMLEMSMLSGVNDALDNLSDFDGDNSALAQFALNSMWSYLTQGTTNTLLGQAEQFSEKYRQTYYTDKDNPFIGPSLQKKIAKLGNKTPGKDYQAADYIDAWGRKQENDENLLTRAFNTFINPGYVSDMDKKEEKANDVVEMLYNFGKRQTYRDDFPNVVPQTPSRNTTVNGKKLTPEEYEVYATTAGQAKLDAVNEFAESELYKSMDNFSRADTVQEIYSYSAFLAASKIAEQRGEDYWDDTFSPLITGEKQNGEKTYKDPIKEEDIPEYLAFKNEYDAAMKAEDYDTIDVLLDSAKNLSQSARNGALDREDKMGTLMDLKKAGLPSAKVYYQFQDDMKSIYEGEKRAAPKSSDYIRVAGNGKYSPRAADAIMNYETSVSEKTVARYQDQVRYNLNQAGMSGSYRDVWNMVQSVADGDMTKDQFKAYVEKNVPLRYQQALRDIVSNYSEDRHVAGKTVSGIYRAARAVGSTPQEALQFYNLIDTNYNGSYTKKEFDAACRAMYGNTDAARQVRALLKEYVGK